MRINPKLTKAQNEYDRMYKDVCKVRDAFSLIKDKTSQRAHSLANRHNSLAEKLKTKQAEIDKLKVYV